MRHSSFLLAVGLSAWVTQAAFAQPPSAEWRTLSTPHFRVHYTASAEEWTRYAAARLEAIREKVAEVVGYAPPEVVDVIVADPVAAPNGMAYPFLGSPRMVLWTSPPGPESAIGHYGSWPELLIVHEETHLVHLLRPSRNPLRQLLARLVPAGPVALSSPRWVTEGYATVIEGRLTGSGRPNGDLRAAILRRWAQTGKLPSYQRLAADAETWQGMSLAYLLGSAYLEWLEERAGPGSLKSLWARMSARRARSFEEAFAGVFGDRPQELYDRFRAELTWRAMEAERLRAPSVSAGELFADLTWTTGAPAVSPDGKLLALVLRGKDKPSRLVVWSTEPDQESEEEQRKQRDEILAADPEDVAAVRTRPLAKKALYTLAQTDGVEPTMPRFLPDGRSILFVRFEPDADGVLHPDLFLWSFETGGVRRVTKRADLRDPDPAPDSNWAAATRNRHGFSQIVRVDLASGEVSALTPPSIETTVDQPRVAPDGTRVAYARHTGDAWEIVVQDLESGETVTLAAPPDGTLASPAWSRDGNTLYASVGAGGFIDLHAFSSLSSLPSLSSFSSLSPTPLTRTQGAALAPEPTPDGTGLYFLSLEPGGLDLRRLALPGEARAYPSPSRLPATLAPAVRPIAPAEPATFSLAEIPAGRSYGLGRQEISWLLGGSGTSDGGAWEAGVRGGDVVGRLDWLAVGAVGSGGWTEGAALAASYHRIGSYRGFRGYPVELSLHLWDVEERPLPDRRGAEIAAGWTWTASGESLRLNAHAAREEVGSLDRRATSAEGAFRVFRERGPLRLDLGLSGRYEAGETAERSFRRWGGEVELAVGSADAADAGRLALTWSRHGSRDVAFAFDLYALGGGESTLLPRSVSAGRIAEPALPLGTLLGTEQESQRVELKLPFLPAPLFYARHRLWQDGQAKGDWLSLAGIELRLRLDRQPLLFLPALDLRAGVAKVLDEPFDLPRIDDDLRWWLVTAWRP